MTYTVFRFVNIVVVTPVNYEQPANLLKAMAHPIRLQILDMLRLGETCVCHIEAVLGLRQSYISQQLMVLREAGLVECRKEGLRVYYGLRNADVDTLLMALCGPVSEQPPTTSGCACPKCTTLLPLNTISTGETSCCK